MEQPAWEKWVLGGQENKELRLFPHQSIIKSERKLISKTGELRQSLPMTPALSTLRIAVILSIYFLYYDSAQFFKFVFGFVFVLLWQQGCNKNGTRLFSEKSANVAHLPNAKTINRSCRQGKKKDKWRKAGGEHPTMGVVLPETHITRQTKPLVLWSWRMKSQEKKRKLRKCLLWIQIAKQLPLGSWEAAPKKNC